MKDTGLKLEKSKIAIKLVSGLMGLNYYSDLLEESHGRNRHYCG